VTKLEFGKAAAQTQPNSNFVTDSGICACAKQIAMNALKKYHVWGFDSGES
jgi:hypothetical protein